MKNLEYCGGGYFREKTDEPVGVARPIYHAPALFAELEKDNKELRSKVNELQKVVNDYDKAINQLPKDTLVHFCHLLYGDYEKDTFICCA